MHTFRERNDGKYDVGMWIENRPANLVEFWKAATVPTLEDALQLTNYLNGGEGDDFTKLFDKVKAEKSWQQMQQVENAVRSRK